MIVVSLTFAAFFIVQLGGTMLAVATYKGA
jgi:hypothetical protein